MSNGKIELVNLKERFSNKYPHHPLANILLNEPDEMKSEEFLTMTRILLNLADLERTKNEKNQVRKGGFQHEQS